MKNYIIITWSHHLRIFCFKDANEHNGTDNDNHRCHHREDKIDIGEKVLQSFHELFIAAVYI